MKMKLAIGSLAFLLLICVAGASDLTLWYGAPGTVNITQGLLLGNGRMGAIIPGNVTNESIVLNDSSLWAGSTNLSGGYTTGNNTAFGAYQTFGNLLINLPGQTGYTGYKRLLDIGTGVATVDYTNGVVAYHREIFCSAPDQVLVVQLTASAAAAYTGSIQLADGHSNTVSSVSGGLMFSGTLPNGELYEAQLQVASSGGTLVNSGGVISFTNCDSLTLVVALGTDYVMDYSKNYHGNNPHTNVVAQAAAAAVKSFATLETAHTNDFDALFNRVAINLGTAPAGRTNLPTDQRITANAANDDDPGMERLMFQYGRYLMISSSRTGLPMNLNGLWNDNNNPAWAADYHTDINIQMMYWLAEVANLGECVQPFVNYVQSQIPWWRYVTTNTSSSINNGGYGGGFGGTNGWTLRCSGNINGGQGWNWIQSGNAWYCLHLWEHYAFGGDTNYLRNTAYPILKETCQFWQQHLNPLAMTTTDGVPAGTLIATNGWSPEHGPNENGVTFDQVLIWDLFQNYQQTCSILNTDAVYALTVSNLQANMLLPRTGPWGELREWLYTADNPTDDHRHTMHLICLYPGRQVTPRQTPALAAAARVGLLARGDTGDSGYEWAHAWRISLFARLHDWWSAHHKLQLYCSTLEPNLTGYYSSATPQWDGPCGVTAGITEMLLQSHENEINLLPALPAAWPAGSVAGLCARGGNTVDITWTNAAATATLHVGLGGSCRVRTPNPASVTKNGVPVSVTNPEADVAVWPANAGDVFVVSWVQPPVPATQACSGQNGQNIMSAPLDFATGINIGTALTWISGGTNYQHNLYFGSSSNAVVNATTNSPEFQGRLSVTNFSLPLLQSNTTYFWRVDEVSGTNTGTGVLWCFTTSSSFAATNPVPAVAQTKVPVSASLAWTPGVKPNTNCLHDVYLGTGSSAVAAATTNSPLYQGRLASPAFTPGAALQTNTTYYWRVDEIAGTAISQGAVWSFTTAGDLLHSSLNFYYTCDTNDVLNGTNLFDRSGTPPNNGTLDPGTGLPGFGAGQVKQAMVLNGSSQYAAAPAPAIGTSNATFLCWINRNGSQSSYAGIMFCRGATTVSGLDFNGGNNTLGYHWNNDSGTYSYSSGLLPPTNQWSLVALVVTPTNAVFYLGKTNGTLTTATHTYTHGLQAFDGPVCLGQDSTGGRLFNGAMDEACFWTRSLSAAEVGQIFTNGLNGVGLPNPPAPAVPLDTWTGGGTNNNWSAGGNWGGTAPNVTGDNLLFTGSVRPNNTNDWVTAVGWVRLNPGTAFTNNGTALTISSGITNFAQKNVWNIPLTLGANQSIDTAGSSALTVNGIISGGYGLSLADSGTVTLTPANTYTGGTTVTGGTLVEKIAASGGTGPLTINTGAKVSYQVGTYAQASFASLNIIGGTFSIDAASQNQVNCLKPVLMQGGVMTSTNGLSGPANDGGYGNFLLNGGVLTISGSSQSIINATTFGLANGASFNVGVTGAGVDLVLASVINNGALIKNGSGTMALTGANTYTGTTTVNSGTLLVGGSIATGAVTVNAGGILAGTGSIGGAVTVNNGATVRVNPAATGVGKLTVNSLAFTSSATNILCVSRNGGVATNDLVQVSGGVTFGGTLVVTNIGTNALMAGDSFKLFNAGAYAGMFANLALPAVPNGLRWNTNTLATNGTLTVVVITFTLIYHTGSNGTISGVTNQTVNYGGSGSAVMAVTNSGYAFTNWSDGVTANPRTDLNVTSNINVTANFASLPPVMVVPPLVITNANLAADGISFTVSGSGTAGQGYVLLTATNLSSAWVPVLTNRADSNGNFSFTDSHVTNYAQRFYRVQTQP